ncbi:MAG: KPN_02809 family neutral zinc metallopeptidase [Tepidisphaeraceae bacterium]
MLWRGQRESDNIEDRRGMPIGGIMGGGGATVIVVILISLLLGKNPLAVLQMLSSQDTQQVQTQETDSNPQGTQAQDPLRQFVGVVLADTEDVWSQLMPAELGRPYVKPHLVLFSGQTESGCGFASSATGPFYCPEDQKVYLDLSFFQQLRDRFHAPGDFAMAYVIAHEVGHHVQNLSGQDMSAIAHGGNEASVRLELQADYLAGVWAHHAQQMKKILEPGDIDEALKAANAIGDDTLQRQTQGRVVPDSFTHGTSEQRVRWFKKGFESGDVRGMKALFTLPYGSL